MSNKRLFLIFIACYGVALLFSSNSIAFLVGLIGVTGIVIQYKLNFERLKANYNLTGLFIILMIIGIIVFRSAQIDVSLEHTVKIKYYTVGLLIVILGFSCFSIHLYDFLKIKGERG